MDGCDGGADGRGEAGAGHDVFHAERLAVEVVVDDGAGVFEGCLAPVRRGEEREPAPDARRQRADGDQVGRLLGFGALAPRNADDPLLAAGADEASGVEVARPDGPVRGRLPDVEVDDGRRRQRG